MNSDHQLPISSEPASRLARDERCVGQAEFEVEFFGRILAESPDNLDVLRCQADLLNSQGAFEQALIVDVRLAALAPEDCVAHYNLACSLARVARLDESLAALRTALSCGFRDFDHLDRDDDLNALRQRPDLDVLLREFRQDAGGCLAP